MMILFHFSFLFLLFIFFDIYIYIYRYIVDQSISFYSLLIFICRIIKVKNEIPFYVYCEN